MSHETKTQSQKSEYIISLIISQYIERTKDESKEIHGSKLLQEISKQLQSTVLSLDCLRGENRGVGQTKSLVNDSN